MPKFDLLGCKLRHAVPCYDHAGSPAFGIQEENHFPDVVREILPGTAEIRKGYLYWRGKPG